MIPTDNQSYTNQQENKGDCYPEVTKKPAVRSGVVTKYSCEQIRGRQGEHEQYGAPPSEKPFVNSYSLKE